MVRLTIPISGRDVRFSFLFLLVFSDIFWFRHLPKSLAIPFPIHRSYTLTLLEEIDVKRFHCEVIVNVDLFGLADTTSLGDCRAREDATSLCKQRRHDKGVRGENLQNKLFSDN